MTPTPSLPSITAPAVSLLAFSGPVTASYARSSAGASAHPLYFDILPHSSALDKIVSIFFSMISPLFSRNTRVGTPSSQFNRFSPFFALSASPFRINTCKNPSKQTTLSAFRINTYEKPRGAGWLWLTSLPSVLCLILLLSPVARAQRQNDPASSKPLRIEVFQSSEELHETMQEKAPMTFRATRLPDLTITVNDAVKYQQIDGFGASLTDSSAWLIWNKLTEAQRKEALEMLFSPTKGIGLSILRQPMGASDFALTEYSYDDLPPGQPFGAADPDLKHFSIEHDRTYILPLLREALALNPNLRIFASPWSPPGWMKTSGSMVQARFCR